MRKFALTSSLFEGEVYLTFDDKDVFASIDFIKSGVSIEQQVSILHHLPANVTSVNCLIRNSTSGKITEIVDTIDFDKFWGKYDDKLNSSKKKTLKKWNSMPEIEQVKAYNYIMKYFNNIPMGTRKKYAETYLNSELWNN